MAKGGARAVSGPAPDPSALRRDRDGDGWVTLPQSGRQGPAPKWPLTDPTTTVDGEEVVLEALRGRELELWKREWRRPQALMWERNGQEHEVALYVRSLATAERADASTMSRTLVRQLQESLGISLPGLSRNRWRIADVQAEAGVGVVKSSARGRFKVVTGGDRAA